jgi:hypothetical protein
MVINLRIDFDIVRGRRDQGRSFLCALIAHVYPVVCSPKQLAAGWMDQAGRSHVGWAIDPVWGGCWLGDSGRHSGDEPTKGAIGA